MKNFIGRIALLGGDGKALREVALLGKTYVEIGTLFGGSACIAGLAGCEVFCIDPLDGYYSKKSRVENCVDWQSGLVPSPSIVRENWANLGLDPIKLHLYRQLHPPWPKELDRTFDIGMIDGDHRYGGAMLDYLGMSSRVNYLLFHDINKGDVRCVYDMARRGSTWDEYKFHPSIRTVFGALRRANG